MATAIGYSYLARYYEADTAGRADLLPMLNKMLGRGYITQAEYDRALTGAPPEGYIPPLALVADDAPADLV